MGTTNPNAPPVTGSQLYGFYLEKDSLSRSPAATSKTWGFIQLGSPPKGFKDSNDNAKGQMDHFWKFWVTVQEYLFKKFDAKRTLFYGSFFSALCLGLDIRAHGVDFHW